MVQCEKALLVSTKNRDAEADYHAIKAWLPDSVSAILDIGCGNRPRIDVWLLQHYGAEVMLHLMDGNSNRPAVGKENVGFNKETTAWRSRYDAIAFLKEKVPGCRVKGHPPNPALTIPCDLIISRRSWGHHYPISTYIDLVDRSLRPNGRIITDIRIGTDGLKTFGERGFYAISENLEVRGQKSRRFALARKTT